MTKQSILHPKWGGLFVFSGLQGLGKSDLAFRADRPEMMGVIDFDLKGEDMAREYQIKNFWQPTAFMKADMDPTEYDRAKIADWAVEKITNLPAGTNVLVIDNATALEAGLAHLVEKNPAKYGQNASNVAAGRYGGANPGISILWQNLTAYLKNHKGVRLIIMVNHMTQPWAKDGPVPNRFHIKGNKIFRNLSAGTFILTPGDRTRGGEPPIPAALVVKEALAIRAWNEKKGEHETQRAIPMRFPIASWKQMSAYFEKPADFKNPAPGETWTQFELNAYGEFLSPEQIQWIKDAAQIKYSEDGEPEKETAQRASQTFDRKKEAEAIHNELEAQKSLSPKQRFVKELIATGYFADASAVAAAMGERKYIESKHDELKQRLLAEAEQRKATEALRENLGAPN